MLDIERHKSYRYGFHAGSLFHILAPPTASNIQYVLWAIINHNIYAQVVIMPKTMSLVYMDKYHNLCRPILWLIVTAPVHVTFRTRFVFKAVIVHSFEVFPQRPTIVPLLCSIWCQWVYLHACVSTTETSWEGLLVWANALCTSQLKSSLTYITPTQAQFTL